MRTTRLSFLHRNRPYRRDIRRTEPETSTPDRTIACPNQKTAYAMAYRLVVPSSRVEEAFCVEARAPGASQPAGWPASLVASELAWLPASVLAWAQRVAVAQRVPVERGARPQGRASQTALA